MALRPRWTSRPWKLAFAPMSGSRSIFLTASAPSRSSTGFRTGTRNCARIAGDLKLWETGNSIGRPFATSETRSPLEVLLWEICR